MGEKIRKLNQFIICSLNMFEFCPIIRGEIAFEQVLCYPSHASKRGTEFMSRDRYKFIFKHIRLTQFPPDYHRNRDNHNTRCKRSDPEGKARIKVLDNPMDVPE